MIRDWKSKSLVAAVALSLLLAPAVARAERPLTLDEALSLSRERNKDLKAARTRVEQAQVGLQNAMSALLPTVAMNAKYTHNYKEVTLSAADLAPPGTAETGKLLGDLTAATIASANAAGNTATANQLSSDASAIAAANAQAANAPPIVIQKAEQLDYALTATIPLLVPAAYPALTATKQQIKAAQYNFQVNEAQVLVQTAQAFFAAAGTDELLTARRNAILVARQTLENAKARLEAGVVNRVEVTRAQLALLRAEQAEREATDQQSQAYRSLRTLIQIEEPFRVVPQDFVNAPPRPMNELRETALKLRPEIPALDATVASYRSLKSSARWQWAPTISAFGNVRAFNYAGFSGNDYSWAVGLSLDWIIYDGGKRDYQARLADAQARENAFRLSLLKDQITDELYNARRALDTKKKALDTALSSVSLSKETLDLVRVQHDAGTATQLDLLQAQDSLVGADVAVAQARFDLALADLQLRRSAGLFPVPNAR
jgi:outer membrane protein TolC